MNVWFGFSGDAHLDNLFRNHGSKQARMDLVASLRTRAIESLAGAVERVPMDRPEILAQRAASGLRCSWNLAYNDEAVIFCLAVQRFPLSPAELKWVAILRACVAADECGDVVPYADMQLGVERRRSQASSGRKRGKSDAVKRRAVSRVRGGALQKVVAAEVGVSDRALREWMKEI